MRRFAPVGLLFLSACSLTPDPTPTASLPAIPDNWVSEHLQEPITGQWLPESMRPVLTQLLQESINHNAQLQAKTAQVEAALQQALIAGADQVPDLSAFIRGGRQKQNNINNSYSAGLDFSWELDIWGKLDDAAKAATLDAKVAVAQWHYQRLQLAAQVSQVWFNLHNSNKQLQLLDKRYQNQTTNQDIIEQSYRSGLGSALDLYLAKADLAAIKARQFAQRQLFAQQQRQLETLLGRYPTAELQVTTDFTLSSADIPTGLPSDILTRRSDIQAASHQIAAADLRVAQAYKNRFPSLRLTGSVGSSSNELNNLTSADSIIWSLFAGVTAPLFDGGKLAALQQQQQAKLKQQVAQYNSTVLSAFVEVENALDGEIILAERQQQLQSAAKNSIMAEQLAFEQYQAGLVQYITVLESQRRAFDAQSAAISIKNDRIQNRINLYLALGGDFIHYTQPDVIRQLETDNND